MKKDRPLFILAGNGSYENRGCEAIVRGTVFILRKIFPDAEVIVASSFLSQEKFLEQFSEEKDMGITHCKIDPLNKRYSPKWWGLRLCQEFFPTIYKKLLFRDIRPFLKPALAVLSVGGDNYSLDYGKPERFTILDDLVIFHKKTLVIWGASIGPFSQMPLYERYMSKHLSKVDAIYARESKTVEYLENIGVRDNVRKVADPAFLMEPKKPGGNLFSYKIPKGSIGINFSPLYFKYMDVEEFETFINLFSEIVRNIYDTFKKNIVLIYHVTSSNSNDFELLENVYEKCAESCEGKLFLLPQGLNAAQIKWIIAKLEVFIGCRTHSVIAALSSGIPSIALSYSVKSEGIFKDIFGDNDLCIGPKELNPDKVCVKLKKLYNNYEKIKTRLVKKSGQIKKEAMAGGYYLKELLKEKDNV